MARFLRSKPSFGSMSLPVTDEHLRRLAEAAGLEIRWQDFAGAWHDVSVETLRAVLTSLDLPCRSSVDIAESRSRVEAACAEMPALAVLRCGERLGTRIAVPAEARIVFEGGGSQAVTGDSEVPERPGYHHIEMATGALPIAVSPGRCFAAPAEARRLWGVAVQVYGIRRAGDGGIGDFTALESLTELVARHGAAAIGVSPVHAQFTQEPRRSSPYAPSSRLFYNAMHIDAAALCRRAGVVVTEEEQALLALLERSELVDWPRAGGLRRTLLRRAFDAMRRIWLQDPDNPDFFAFHRYRAARGIDLENHALFEALDRFFAQGVEGRTAWQEWPDPLKTRDPAAMRTFAERSAEEVQFHAFLQWQAEQALEGVQRTARDAGMRVGLISDIAVGTDRSGSQTWSNPAHFLVGLSVGAPPDLINPLGQDWGLTAFSPRAFLRDGYGPFISILRAAMRHAGGVRIDHILGLRRLWLVPSGAAPSEGVYLRFPQQDLLDLVALESVRHSTIVVGEDLGTVPEGFRNTLAERGISGTRVMWFEREGAGFAMPDRYQRDAIAMTSTHDLPTVAGWWRGRDLAWRERFGLLGRGVSREMAEAERALERAALWRAFIAAGAAEGDPPAATEPSRVVDAAAAFLGSTGSQLALLPMEDVLALAEQPNLPGTVDQHPNWRRRLPAEVGHVLSGAGVADRLRRLAEARGS